MELTLCSKYLLFDLMKKVNADPYQLLHSLAGSTDGLPCEHDRLGSGDVAAVCLYDLSKDGAEIIPGYMLLKVYSDGISLIDLGILPEFRRRGLASAAISRVKRFLELTDGGYFRWHCPSETVATAAVGLMLANEFSFQASVTGPSFTWSRKRAVPPSHKLSAKLFAKFAGLHGDDSGFDELAAAMDGLCAKASDTAPTGSR